MPQEYYKPSQHIIWSDAKVSTKIHNLQLVPKKHALLMSGIYLKHFRLTKCLQLDQAFNKHKYKWVLLLSAERRASIILLVTIDQIMDVMYHIEQSVEAALPGILLPLQVQDTYKLDLPTIDGLGSLDPSHLGSVFPSVELD